MGGGTLLQTEQRYHRFLFRRKKARAFGNCYECRGLRYEFLAANGIAGIGLPNRGWQMLDGLPLVLPLEPISTGSWWQNGCGYIRMLQEMPSPCRIFSTTGIGIKAGC